MKARPGAVTRALLFLPAVLLAVAAVVAGGSRLFRADTDDHESRKHGHRSVHGGMIQSTGEQHVELLLEKGGRVRLYLLGEDEMQLRPVPEREMNAEALPEGETEALSLTLRAEPQPGEPPGFASTFAGTLPAEIAGRPMTLSLNIPSADRLYRVRFPLEPKATHPAETAQAPMPAGAGADEQDRLHRTPGGLYTVADIAANGDSIPSEKYRGMVASHDMYPAAGDRICPITNTKANPRFAWTVGGKQYLFCCPPCIDEFVQRAKTTPESIRPPQTYVKH